MTQRKNQSLASLTLVAWPTAPCWLKSKREPNILNTNSLIHLFLELYFFKRVLFTLKQGLNFCCVAFSVFLCTVTQGNKTGSAEIHLTKVRAPPWFASIPPLFTPFFTVVCALQPSPELNASCLWPLQRNTSVLCPSRAVCFPVVGLVSAPLVCTRLQQTRLRLSLSIQYLSQVTGSQQAPISFKPSP